MMKGETTNYWDCPVCGKPEGLRVSPGDRTAWILLCRRCGGGGSFPAEVADAVGASVPALLSDPAAVLGRPAMVKTRKRGTPPPLPSRKELERWGKRLRRNGTRRTYLTDRGLTKDTIQTHELGWDGEAYVMPVFDEYGELVNLVRHRPGGTPKYKAATGHPAALYPYMPGIGDWVVLVAGMFDALVGVQHGLPAVTTTCGSAFPERLAPHFAGQRVRVCFDVGEEKQAALACKKINAAGGIAEALELPLPHGGDLADWFTVYGRTVEALEALPILPVGG